MPKSNPYFIPKENFPKTEQIVYLDQNYQPQSFEEFMKDYNENERIDDNYQGEFEGYEDMRIKGTYYGPGFWDDVVPFVGKAIATTAAAGAIVATGGTAAPLIGAGM